MMSSYSAFIGDASIPRLGVLQIEEIDSGYRISRQMRDDYEKLEILRSLGRIRKGQMQKAKFLTNSGSLVNDTFEIAESRFDEEQLPDQRLLVFTILLKK
jgi:hypothetical protein